jgi:hypothetical protein
MKNVIGILILFVALCVFVYIVHEFYLPDNELLGVDWVVAYQPAADKLLSGENPYDVDLFYNPPWALFPLIPITFLPVNIAICAMFVLNIMAYVFVMHKFKYHVITMALFILFSRMWINSYNANIDGFVALGFLLPPQIGLFIVLLKPQLGLPVALFWAFQAYQVGGVKRVIQIFLPVAIAFLISFFIYGMYMTRPQDLLNIYWNASIFPYGVPVGILLIVLSLMKMDIRFAIAAGPFLSPYLSAHAWAFSYLGILAFLPSIHEKIKSFLHRQSLNVQKNLSS